MKIRRAYFCTGPLLALLGTMALAADPAASTSKAPLAATPPSIAVSPVQDLRVELEQLRSTVIKQGQDIADQKGELAAYARRKDGSITTVFTAIATIAAAGIGGFFLLRNQNKQAAQGRLLKAVELIMESRSGYQADIRRKNLSVFLDDATREHLEGIRDEFSGPEFTDLNLALAQAMSEKAETPQEVLNIWKCVLKDKKFFDRIEYRRAEHNMQRRFAMLRAHRFS